LTLTERFRTGVISKVSAILELQGAIPRVESDETTYLAALGSYMRVLDNFECIRERVAPPEFLPGRALAESQIPIQNVQESLSKVPLQYRISAVGPSQSRQKEAMRKRSIDTSAFAWVIRDEIEPPNLSPSLRQTQATLENFSRDLKQAKASLLNSARVPQFPDSEWTNLLAGRAVDLDHVLAGMYSISHMNANREVR
jgi:hypothetical protein